MALPRFFAVVLTLFAAALAAPAAANDASLERLERALKLNPLQKYQFDVALQATQRAMFAIGMGALQFKTRLATELLKDRPDSKALAQAQDELVDMSRPHVRAARDEWMRFYAMLDEEQVGAAREFMDEKLRKLDQLAEHLLRNFAAQERSTRPRRSEPPMETW